MQAHEGQPHAAHHLISSLEHLGQNLLSLGDTTKEKNAHVLWQNDGPQPAWQRCVLSLTLCGCLKPRIFPHTHPSLKVGVLN